jgi:hypothetical protein
MKFAIHYTPENDTQHYRATDFTLFFSELRTIETTGDDLSKFLFYVDGKPVSFDQAKAAANEVWDAWEAKRAATKKPVWIHQGGSNAKNTWHKVWVKK